MTASVAPADTNAAAPPAADPLPAAIDEPVQALGLPAIDPLLGGGLATGCVHEISGPPDDTAAFGFAAALLARFARRGPVVWITPRRATLYAPGLCGLGLAPDRLLIIEASARTARLWALAETLRTPGIVAALAELDAVDFPLTRRLQLAARTTGASGLILDEGPLRRQASAARTRWRIAAARSQAPIAASSTTARAPRAGLGPPRWHLDLLRGPAAATGSWIIECTTEGFRHVDPPDARAASPSRADPGRSAAGRAARHAIGEAGRGASAPGFEPGADAESRGEPALPVALVPASADRSPAAHATPRIQVA